MPWSTPGMPLVMAAPPAASTPTRRARVSTNPANVPAALEPPPMHATTTSGSAPASTSRALAAGLLPDDALQLADHVGEGMRTHHRAQAVVRGLDRRHPFPHGLVHRVLQRPAPGRDRSHLRPEQLHPEDVELLPLRVDLAHEHGALQAEECGRGRRGHPVLARPRLGDHARLAHPLREQRLAHDVVDLVRAGVRQVLPLEEDAHPETLRQAGALGHRRRPPAVVAQQPVELGTERRVAPGVVEPLLQFQAGRHQRLGDEAAAELPEPAVGARPRHQAVAFAAHPSLQS